MIIWILIVAVYAVVIGSNVRTCGKQRKAMRAMYKTLPLFDYEETTRWWQEILDGRTQWDIVVGPRSFDDVSFDHAAGLIRGASAFARNEGK